MKKIYFLFLMALLPLLANAVVKRTIHVDHAGTLSNYISEDDKYQIEELILTGEINGDDLGLIREMAGCSFDEWYSSTGNEKLIILDLSGINIVAGGSVYFLFHYGYENLSYQYYKIDNNNEIPAYAFYGSHLQKIILPANITSIRECAFSGCDNLKTILIPNSVTSIGGSAFYRTAWYDNQPDGIVYAGKVAYNYKGNMPTNTTLTLKKGTKEIASGAFSGCSTLSSVKIPNSVTSIGDWAFYNCANLKDITIPNSVTSIGGGAFYGTAWYDNQPDGVVYAGKVLYKYKGTMPYGTTINIKEGTLGIAGEALYGNNDLPSITIPNSVISIGSSAFAYCSSLTSIKVENGNPVYDSRDNCNAIIETQSNTLITGCKKTIIPNDVTSIGPSAFSGSTLTSINIPNSVTSIGGGAFSGCESLTSVIIGNGVTSIAREAFFNCKNLISVYFGKGLTTIGEYAFFDCSNIVNMHCYTESFPPNVGYWAFYIHGLCMDDSKSYLDQVTLHVPKSYVTNYKDNCKGFKDIVAITSNVKLSKSEAIIEKGKTVTLKATVTPSTLLDKSVTWKSSNTKVATVTSKGKVKGIKAGTATITCISKVSGIKATCKVTVINGTVTLNKTEAIIEKGKTTTLKATLTPTTLEDMSVTWKSSDKSIATVTSKGKVKGVGYGTATITCTSNATGVSATCQVTVGKVVINMPEFTLRKTRTVTLKATIYPTTVTDKSVTWKSSDTKVATVTSSGKVKGIAAGTAIITCTSVATGLKGTCTVTVLATTESRSVEGDDDDVTGIENLEEAPALVEPYDVYDLSGRKVRHQVTSLDGLPDGVYIVNGKKMLKK